MSQDRKLKWEEQIVLSQIESEMGRPLPYFDWFAGNRIFGVRIIKSNVFLLLINNRDVSKLPKNLGNLIKIRVLDVGRNSLRSLPPSIGDCRNLSQLYAGRNRLEYLPSQFANLSNLHILELQHNRLKELIDMSSFPKLKRLNANHNDLIEMPQNWQLLQDIEQINLNTNSISSLEDPLELSKLVILDLSGNSLNQNSSDFSKFINLKSLDLSNNDFAKFPYSIRNLKNLEIIYLNGNGIKQISYEDLSGLTDLKLLDLRGTKITQDELLKIKTFSRLISPDLQVRCDKNGI